MKFVKCSFIDGSCTPARRGWRARVKEPTQHCRNSANVRGPFGRVKLAFPRRENTWPQNNKLSMSEKKKKKRSVIRNDTIRSDISSETRIAQCQSAGSRDRMVAGSSSGRSEGIIFLQGQLTVVESHFGSTVAPAV